LEGLVDGNHQFVVDVMSQQVVEVFTLQIVEDGLQQVASDFGLPDFFRFLALRAGLGVLVLAQHVEVVGSWGEDREDDAVGVLLGGN
jgi:hypothetical protein